MGVGAGDWGGGGRSLYQLVRAMDRDRFEPFFLLPRKGPILPELERRGIGYRIWGEEKEPRGAWSYLKAVLAAMRLYKSVGIDLLHVNHAHYWRPAEILAARLLDIPIITHLRLVQKRVGPFFRFSTLIIANSNYTACHSDTAGVPTRVVYNMVDIDAFSAAKNIRGELGLREADTVVTFAGQIKAIKGVDMFIELARRIPDRGVRFIIAGPIKTKSGAGGAYSLDQLKEKIAGLPNVHYVGFRSDMENLYHSSDVVVFPSQWNEPFGRITIEAGAACRPVVASRVGGIPEALEHGESGFLFDPYDLDALEHYTRRLLRDSDLRIAMGRKGRQLVEKKFHSSSPRQMEEIYEELVTARGPRTR